MKIASRWFIAASALAVALALPANAYNDTVTHPTLTLFSVEKSAIFQEPTLLFRLGVPPTNPTREAIRALMMRGVIEEDEGSRAFNHFYDPIKDRPLTVGIELGKKSWEWMLEFPDPIGDQQRSLADAHAYLQSALTNNGGTPEETEHERDLAMGMLFLSLGSAVHHMQDMAQPQHVRNDQHLDKYPMGGLNPFYRPSLYESYTKEQNAKVIEICEATTAVFPGAASLKTAGDFWFNPAEGIAQYTNRHFVSAGTNFKMFRGQANADGTYPQPTPGATSELTIEQLFTDSKLRVPDEVRSLCGMPAINCTMTMYATDTSSHASTLSIFDQDLRAFNVDVAYVGTDITPPSYSVDRIFALNRFNFDEAHPVLIRKAVSYSAGIINHFFRGKLEVTPPETGPYAAVAQAEGVGFKTIRASVTNATPGEALPNGSLMAIARFHRNHCYKPDLSGEFTQTDTGQPVVPCADYRSSVEHIRVSNPLTVAFAVDEQKKNLTFQFHTPIPLDATDLVLQVYYQKTDKAGSKEEMFALGAVDLSEPTFVAIMNATDVFELPTGTGGQFFYYTDIIKNITSAPYRIVDANRDGTYGSPPDVNVRGGYIRYGISVDGQHVGDTWLPEGRFARLAVLGKPTGLELALTAQGNGFSDTDFYSMVSKTSQLDPATNVYTISTVSKLRNHTLQYDSVSYYHFYPSHSALLKTMPPSKAESATEPVAIQIADVPQQMHLAAPLSDMQRPRLQEAGTTGIRLHRSSPSKIRTTHDMRKTEEEAPKAPAL